MAVAETTAGGLVSAALVAVPGSSGYFERGIVAYSKESKLTSLGMDETELDADGAVSAETAAVMAKAVQDLAGATYGLAETGIAGPIRGRSPKPIGTVHLAIASPDGVKLLNRILAHIQFMCDMLYGPVLAVVEDQSFTVGFRHGFQGLPQ